MKKLVFGIALMSTICSVIGIIVCVFVYRKKRFSDPLFLNDDDEFFDYEDEELDEELGEGGCVSSCHARETMGL